MKISYKMYKDLNTCCDAATKWFYEYYVKGKNYEETTEANYHDVCNEILECFDNGFMEENNIDFPNGRVGSMKMLTNLKYSAEAILYYPDNVIYRDEYRLTTPIGRFKYNNIAEANEKRLEVIKEMLDANNLYKRYNVSQIDVKVNDNEKTVSFLNTIEKEDDLTNDAYYFLNSTRGQKFELYGKEALLKTMSDEYKQEAEELNSQMFIEQKIEDTVDNFTAWLKI